MRNSFWTPLTLCLALSALPACSEGPGRGHGGDSGPDAHADAAMDAGTGDGGDGDPSTGADSGDGAGDQGSDAGLDGSGFAPVTLPDGALVFPTNDAGQVLCGQEPCACSDGLDNDGDGQLDGFDPECTGPYDDDEGSFATGISGDNVDRHQDCFFDGNSGSGGGDCMIDESCLLDRDSQACADSFKGQRTLEGEEMKCENFCEPRTPNGCDCFGCCEVFTASGSTHVLLDPECQVELDAQGHGTVGDDCRTCTPSVICGNECGECELCLGRSLDALPETCTPAPPADGGTPSDDAGTSDPPPANECTDGAGNAQPACDATHPCGAGAYCYLGCCLPTLI